MKIIFEYNGYDDWRKYEEIYKDMLEELSQSKNSRLREVVALNERTPKAILEEYSMKDSDSFVRWAVARNKKTDANMLSYLSKDKCEEVREAVAESCNTSAETLEELSEEDSKKIRKSVALNPNLSKNTFDKLLEDRELWTELTFSPFITVEILEGMKKELSEELDKEFNLKKLLVLSTVNQKLDKLKEN